MKRKIVFLNNLELPRKEYYHHSIHLHHLHLHHLYLHYGHLHPDKERKRNDGVVGKSWFCSQRCLCLIFTRPSSQLVGNNLTEKYIKICKVFFVKPGNTFTEQLLSFLTTMPIWGEIFLALKRLGMKVSVKHRKNCECCPMSLLIVR